MVDHNVFKKCVFVLFLSSNIFCQCGCDMRKTKERIPKRQHLERSEIIAQDFVNSVNTYVWSRTEGNIPLRILDKSMNELCNDHLSRKKVLIACVEKLLSSPINIERFIRDQSVNDHYLQYIRGIDVRLYENGISDSVRAKYFLRGVEKYCSIGLHILPEDSSLSYHEWLVRDSAYMWLRNSVRNNLRLVDKGLFISYLPNISQEKRGDIKCDFSNLYTSMMQQMAKVERFLKGKRSPPPSIQFHKTN